MTEPAPVKRHRSANWEMDEKKLMRDVIKPYLHIIETKKLTLEANAAKINAWKEITEKFNKVNDTTRSMKQIMIQWKINKNICKAKFAAHCIPKMGPLKVLKPVTPTAPPLKLGVTIIKEEPQKTSSNLIELDSYNVMGSTLKGSKMTNVVITCAKPKASTLKEDGNIQKLVVIPASITQSETTDPLETKQEIPETENDPLAMLEDVIIPVPVEIPEITEEIVTEQLDDEYYDDIADTAAPTSPEVVKEEMAEEVPAIATSPKDVSKSPEREAEKVLEEDPAIPKVTTDDVPQSSEEIAEKIAAVVPGEATNTEPAQKPIRRRRKRTSKAAKEDNNATKTANQEAADQQFLSYSQAVYNDKAHYRKLENERLTAEHSLRMTCMSEQHQEIIKILKLQQEVLKKQLNNGHGSTTT
ncbi:uncharacterized protein LOC105393980 isoform X2 [Plutella xylostella]|uniref:uncharacterized protein LOC105393980 isoform X2 n=1 Tax=Plutella xylostella TaxID=51655 RepID=UPI002032CA98|nr:uncharacterized protein LOC105393980 isoform X2 [Plutella xylostella]